MLEKPHGNSHVKCYRCWRAIHKDDMPYQLSENERVQEMCCFCGRLTKEGIYTTAFPYQQLHCTHTKVGVN